MLTLSAGMKLLVIAHLMRNKQVIEKSFRILQPAHFHDDDGILQLLWSISRDWFKQHSKVIPKEYVLIQVDERLKDDPLFLGSDQVEELHRIIDGIYSVDESVMYPDVILEQIQLLLNEQVKQVVVEVVDSHEALDNYINTLTQTYNNTRISTAKECDIFSEDALATAFPVKKPFGIPFIDSLLDGGSAVGEVYGLLGVSGMGKSMLSQQMAIEKARRREHVAIFHYEMDVMPVVQKRVYGYLAEIPKDMLNKYSTTKEWPQQYQQALQKQLDEFARDYLHVIDMKLRRGTGVGGMADIRAALRDLSNQGKHCEFVVIDQLLPMIKRHLAATNQKQDTGVQRMLMQGFVDDAIRMASPSDMATTMLIVHQSSSDVKSRPAVVKPKQGESMEDRSFDNWLTYCIAIGTQDEERRCWCNTTKARNNSRDGHIIQLNQHLPRFDYVPNKFRAERQGFVTQKLSGQSRTYSNKPNSGKDSENAITV